MNIVIIPGFLGYPEEKTFEELELQLTRLGHKVIKIAWPNFPNNLENYCFTQTIEYSSKILNHLVMQDTIILGFSMGGVIACHLANIFSPKKLGFVVSPYQAGSEDDLEGEYKSWKELGYRDITSSRFGDLKIPFSFIEDARKYNGLTIVPNIKCPILFIVGQRDEKVPVSVTRKLYEKANDPKVWHEIPDMEHKYQYQSEILPKVNKIVIEFVEE